MKKIPYGLSDFPRIIREDYYYVDKSHFIELIEDQPPYLFLIRPRRFGKSLFLALVETYYDVRYAGSFEEIFGHLYIGKHPTPSHNQYLVLRFNFSEISSNVEEVERSFKEYCCLVLIKFIRKYEQILGANIWKDIKEGETNPNQLLSSINQYATDKGNISIYLLIDEYDNFTNTILSNYGTERYRKATHGEGFIRGFFNTIKAATTGPGSALKRLFITGVSPVTMDDVTSGFNIGTNISMDAMFNSIIGFKETELRKMLTYYKEAGALSNTVDELVETMKPWYDNYCFSEDCLNESMYNSDMTLYFLNNYLLQKKAPKAMVDNNIRTDYNKLRHLIRLDKTFGANASIIQEIISKGSIAAHISTAFPAEDITKPDNFKSLLYYFGLLSIREIKEGDIVLQVPNLTVREQLYTYLAEAYRTADLFDLDTTELSALVKKMAYRGEWEPVFCFFAAELERQSTIREFIEGEAHVKGFLLAYLGLTRGYIILPEHESSKGYADFYMMPDLLHQPDIAYSYIVEVKYATRSDSEEKIATLKAEAIDQLHHYAADPKVRDSKGKTELRLIVLVFKGWELVVMEKIE
ncbi:MAG: ATP-binding protein [Bacteroides sp.]